MAKIIQLVLSVVVMGAGLANLGETAGQAVFAVGGLWFINSVRLLWHGKGAAAIVQFEKGAAAVEDLSAPKQITLTAVNPAMTEGYGVFLNNENIGSVSHSQPFTFSVTKRKNVLHISQWHRNPCFFEVTDVNGPGQLEMRMGFTTPKLVVVENTGLKASAPF